MVRYRLFPRIWMFSTNIKVSGYVMALVASKDMSAATGLFESFSSVAASLLQPMNAAGDVFSYCLLSLGSIDSCRAWKWRFTLPRMSVVMIMWQQFYFWHAACRQMHNLMQRNKYIIKTCHVSISHIRQKGLLIRIDKTTKPLRNRVNEIRHLEKQTRKLVNANPHDKQLESSKFLQEDDGKKFITSFE
jgi:hypothetical protein